MLLVLIELVLIVTGIAGIVANIVLLLAILASGRRTPTHIYIMYMAALSLLEQLVSPAFHHWYVDNFFVGFDVREFLTLVYVIIYLGIINLFALLLFMDYFKWIGSYRYIVMIVHFVLAILTLLIYFFTVEYYFHHIYFIIAVIPFNLLVLQLVFVLCRDVECLKKRKQTDDESTLRYILVMTYICLIIVCVLVFLLENFLSILITRYPALGFFAYGLTQLDSVLVLIVVIKIDTGVKTTLLGLFRMCSCWRSNKVRFENLPNDNGRLLNQDV